MFVLTRESRWSVSTGIHQADVDATLEFFSRSKQRTLFQAMSKAKTVEKSFKNTFSHLKSSFQCFSQFFQELEAYMVQ